MAIHVKDKKNILRNYLDILRKKYKLGNESLLILSVVDKIKYEGINSKGSPDKKEIEENIRKRIKKKLDKENKEKAFQSYSLHNLKKKIFSKMKAGVSPVLIRDGIHNEIKAIKLGCEKKVWNADKSEWEYFEKAGIKDVEKWYKRLEFFKLKYLSFEVAGYNFQEKNLFLNDLTQDELREYRELAGEPEIINVTPKKIDNKNNNGKNDRKNNIR